MSTRRQAVVPNVTRAKTDRNDLIRRLWLQGHSYKKLARWFAISKTRVEQICTDDRRWA